MRKRRDGNTRSNSLRTLWKNAWTYRRLEGFRGGFAIRRQALGTALGLGEKRLKGSGMNGAKLRPFWGQRGRALILDIKRAELRHSHILQALRGKKSL